MVKYEGYIRAVGSNYRDWELESWNKESRVALGFLSLLTGLVVGGCVTDCDFEFWRSRLYIGEGNNEFSFGNVNVTLSWYIQKMFGYRNLKLWKEIRAREIDLRVCGGG